MDEAPFDSGRKMMSTIHAVDAKFVQYTKGGPDVVLSRCDFYLENGEVKDTSVGYISKEELLEFIG